MIIYIIQWTFIYVILIFLLHNLYLFFQNNLTSTLIKDYYNTYNNDFNNNNNNNNTQTNTIKTKKTTLPSKQLQIGSTGLEELNKYNGITNFNQLTDYNNELNNYNDLTNYNNELTNNELTNSMKSELNEFFNKLKL